MLSGDGMGAVGRKSGGRKPGRGVGLAGARRTQPNTRPHVEKAMDDKKSITVQLGVLSGCLEVRVNVTNRAYGNDRAARMFTLRRRDDNVPEAWNACIERLESFWDNTEDKKMATLLLMDEGARIQSINRGVAFCSAADMKAFSGDVYIFAAAVDSESLSAAKQLTLAWRAGQLRMLETAWSVVTRLGLMDASDETAVAYARQHGYMGLERVVVRGVPHGVNLRLSSWQPLLRECAQKLPHDAEAELRRIVSIAHGTKI